MDAAADKDWKTKLGFPINYDSGQSSDDDFDTKDVVMRHPRQSSRYLLAESGDGSEADLLGTTPPRARIRYKEKRRSLLDSSGVARPVVNDSKKQSSEPAQPIPPERLKRASLKLRRSKERDWKQEMGQRDNKADSLPSPAPTTAIPTLVESCSRFMSLTSRLKCRAAEDEVQERWADDELPANRVSFHKTFSMLINMGNVEKGCRRTISREEQVWQNELKDLIWLELQAKIAGRSLAQQDAFLCAQRDIVPSIVQKVLEYKFVNPNPCTDQSRRLTVVVGSSEDLSADVLDCQQIPICEEDDGLPSICVSFDCAACSDAVGVAMRQVSNLLEAFYGSLALYPSSTAAKADQPMLVDPKFQNRIRAMCLWYNIALHMRLKMLSIRRILRTLLSKQRRRTYDHRASTDSVATRQSMDSPRPCQVRFDVSNNTTDSNNSDSSGQSAGPEPDVHKENEQNVQRNEHSNERRSNEVCQNGTGSSTNTDGSNSHGSSDSGQGQDTTAKERKVSAVDEPYFKELSGITTPDTPEIVVSETYSTNDTSASSESGYGSAGERDGGGHVLALGPLADLARLRLLRRTACSPYREYYYEMLKTQGVRRCMMFMNKMCHNLLSRVYFTLLEPQDSPDAFVTDDPSEIFGENKEGEVKSEEAKQEDAMNAHELRRYGCWSEECSSMSLPSYRNHFLLLSSICMEAVHDYLSLRLEGRPDKPSCLTVKQLIHDLKEGLDIATSMRASFARYVEAALRNTRVGVAARRDLLLLLRTFDGTVETALEQYLSYLRTMSGTEALSRACLAAEWAFTARLAARVPPAADRAPAAFTDMACNQLEMVLRRFEEKLHEVIAHVEQSEPLDHEGTRYIAYAMCRATQDVYASEREPTLAAAQWARALAARLPRAHRHLRLQLFNSLMSIRDCIVLHTRTVFEKTRFEYHSDIPKEVYESISPRIRELLLQVYKLGFEIHKELHRFVNDASTRTARRSTQESPARGRLRLLRSESIGEEPDNAVDDRVFDRNFREQSQTDLELLLGGTCSTTASVPTEDRTDGVEFSERGDGSEPSEDEAEWAKRVAIAVIDFANCWMQFVVERCDRGRGLRPRWASQGLEFLMLACEPCNTRHLSESEFVSLKQLMDGCISHVIGSRAPPRADAAPPPPASPAPPHRQRHRIHSPLSNASSREAPTPPTPPGEMEPSLTYVGNESASHHKRVLDAVQQLDEQRDKALRELRAVGRVLEAAVSSYEPKLRQLTFKWQRGLKIGAGTFGKVYTVVNTESGQLLAMKEISIGAGDRRALQRAANELRVLEGILHPHLVRYYGCELHREEMLLFMELCVEGSLEALVGTVGALAELTVRRYTKQLLSAVAELHARSIAHRDIKSGNIFLTNEGHCLKLGDFGCAVKIRANTTAPGELQGFVGTQAYMAPEVFMKSSGHGRAADIWSLGCVVTEMASGKRPFSEYDSNYQIMFVVGMGGRPEPPAALSGEGREFCAACLTHDPDRRPRAETLALHHFLMIKSDDDCKCEPAYLIT
ncbi:mitogen-activated protein kinase kinase kinase 4 [Epargyreus clarus]|uniref:mitogen-activated protein kinase kinase kinase 4 n=1 Tax=Epargyreus clarus TaxID=520877 RepID=UPI003C300112